ncbi:MAG: CbtB domain-containing protein [Alphaproteobacteria bacterium]|nr:CbtB domain-containing protein [Alphaproteobacteria bacterium]
MTDHVVKPSRSEAAADRTTAALPAVLAILLGAFLVFGAGFAQSDTLHNAAHDSRHAFAFPCH